MELEPQGLPLRSQILWARLFLERLDQCIFKAFPAFSSHLLLSFLGLITKEKDAVMLNFHCQSDVIYNYHRNTPLGMLRKVFSERFNWAAKAHPKYVGTTLMGQGPSLNTKRESKLGASIHVSLLPEHSAVSLCCCRRHDFSAKTLPSNCEPTWTFLPKVAVIRHFVTVH